MNKLKLLSIIIILFIKTGNVLYAESIFNVNNIELSDKFYTNKEQAINKGFIDGFNKLINRITLKKDYKTILSTNLKEIKNLVSYYQIIEPNSRFTKENSYLNLYFDKEKINKFFYKKNISYSDLINVEAVILTIHVKADNFFVYNDNFFYNNWKTNEKQESLVEYIHPVESLEIISKINKKKNSLNQLNTKELLLDYESKNLFIVIIDSTKNKNKVLLKSIISGKEIVKNYEFPSEEEKQNKIKNIIINSIKEEIEDLIKSENTLDLTTPTFLNVKLNLKNRGNLFKAQNILNNIDLIDYYYVKEFNNNTANINIKHYGKIAKIKEKLLKKDFILYQENSQWNGKIN